MKHILFLLLSIIACSASAQPIVSDTTFFSAVPGGFSRTQIKVYENGKTLSETVPLDTASLFNFYLGRIQADANAISTAAVEAIKRNRTVRDIKRYDDDVTAYLGVSPADSIAREIFRKKLDGKPLEWDSAGVVVNAQVNPRQQGGYNLRVNAKNYRLHLYEPRWLRVQNFPAQGSNVDLWLFGGAYQSFDRRYVLRAQGGIKLRSLAPVAPAEQAPAATQKRKKKQ